MLKEVTAMEARQTFGELLNEVKYRHDNILITKAGKPIAALIDIELFEKVTKMKVQFKKLTLELANIYKEDEQQEAESDINEAIQKIKGK
jgi:prevent-host-death family protein